MRIARVVGAGLALAVFAATPQSGQSGQVGTAVGVGEKETEKVAPPAELVARLKTQLADARKSWEQAPTRPEQYTRHVAALQATLAKLSPDAAKAASDTLKAHAAVGSAAVNVAVASANPVPVAPPPHAVVATGTFLKPDPAEMKRRADAAERGKAFAAACKEANRLASRIADTSPTGDEGKALFDALAKACDAVVKFAPPAP